MKTEFVNVFLLPCTVINNKTLKDYGSCQGMSRFLNGYFAIMKNDEVCLYKEDDTLVLSGLENVHIFESGHMLYRKKTTSLWTFADKKGAAIEENALDCRVLGRYFAAIKVKSNCWRIYRFHAFDELIMPWSEVNASDVAMLCSENITVVLATKQKKDLWNLQQYVTTAPSVEGRKIENVFAFLEMPNGYILTANVPLCYTETPKWYFRTESGANTTYQLWDSSLKPITKARNGMIILKNGMFFVKKQGQIWELFTASGKPLVANILELNIEAKPESACNLLWGYGSHHVMTFRLFRNGLLHFMCDNTKVVYNANGDVVTEKANADKLVFVE